MTELCIVHMAILLTGLKFLVMDFVELLAEVGGLRADEGGVVVHDLVDGQVPVLGR